MLSLSFLFIHIAILETIVQFVAKWSQVAWNGCFIKSWQQGARAKNSARAISLDTTLTISTITAKQIDTWNHQGEVDGWHCAIVRKVWKAASKPAKREYFVKKNQKIAHTKLICTSKPWAVAKRFRQAVHSYVPTSSGLTGPDGVQLSSEKCLQRKQNMHAASRQKLIKNLN